MKVIETSSLTSLYSKFQNCQLGSWLFLLGSFIKNSLLDICCASFEKTESGKWSFEIESAETIPYSEDWEFKLRNSIQLHSEELLALNSDYGFYLGEKTKNFIEKPELMYKYLFESS